MNHFHSAQTSASATFSAPTFKPLCFRNVQRQLPRLRSRTQNASAKADIIRCQPAHSKHLTTGSGSGPKNTPTHNASTNRLQLHFLCELARWYGTRLLSITVIRRASLAHFRMALKHRQSAYCVSDAYRKTDGCAAQLSSCLKKGARHCFQILYRPRSGHRFLAFNSGSVYFGV